MHVARSRAWVGVVALALAVALVAAWPGIRQPAGIDRVVVEPPAASAEADRGSARPVARFPGQGHEIAQVRSGRQVEVHARPGGEVVERLGARTEFGSRRVLPVIEPRKRWLGIATPELGNGVIGWVRYEPRRLALGDTRISLEVDLSARTIELRRAADVRRTVVVSVGRLGSGTPTGRFAVTDLFLDSALDPVYGSGALALNARQPNLPPGWIGGDRIAIHGWAGPVGDAVSGGCLRASNEDVEALLQRVPLGAPVFIRA